jgi:cysteinyl-tRNA synthetase
MIKIYNTLTRKKEPFKPVEPGKVKMYSCGVTTYDKCHLGHARGAINFDVVRNVFIALGYDVTYVKNYTDIDDKIINRSNEKGVTAKALAEEMIKLHDVDMASLGINPPDIAPKATEHIGDIIALVQRLVEEGYAYESNGDVFFKVRKFPEYGKLSWKNIDDLISGSRVEVNDDKEDALDFALWKSAKPGEPAWESPWGMGRPGWHIECSAMVKKHLGETIDIHAGGSDLIFPHHENEIAQSECANGKIYVNYWMHNGMIKIQQQKMSKSLGNFATIEDLVKKYHYEVIRFFVLSTQYRQSIDFTDEALERAAESLDRIYGALEKYQTTYGDSLNEIEVEEKIYKKLKKRYLEALSDDINTPEAIAVLFDITRSLNSNMKTAAKAKTYYQLLIDLGAVLGIFNINPAEWFKSPRIKREDDGLTDEAIDALIQKRIDARANKDWATADEVRDQLNEAGIVLEDTNGKTTWKRK